MTMVQQDLHIHTTFSTSDNSVVPEQTVSLVAAVKHAIIVGISDHFECLVNGSFEGYEKEIRQIGLKVGVEVDGHPWVDEATHYDVDYYIFHCRDQDAAMVLLTNCSRPESLSLLLIPTLCTQT